MKMLLFIATLFAAVGEMPGMSQSNPSSTNATDIEMQLAWPDGVVDITSVHDKDVTIDNNNSSTPDTYYDSYNWDDSGGGLWVDGQSFDGYTNYYYFSGGQWPEYGDAYEIAMPGGQRYEFTPFGEEWYNRGEGECETFYGSQNFKSSDSNYVYQANDQAQITLFTGGVPGAKGFEFYEIYVSGWASAYKDNYYDGGDAPVLAETPIPPQQLQISSLGTATTNGTLWVSLPEHALVPLTPNGNVAPYESVNVYAQACPLLSLCQATTPSNRERTTLGVGEQVALYFGSSLPTNASWSTTAGGLAVTSGMTNLFTAPSNAVSGSTKVTVTATVLGKSASIEFSILEPNGHGLAVPLGAMHYPVGEIGAGVSNLMTFYPTNVSFYRVFTWELPVGIANITGYFTNLKANIPEPQIGSAMLNQGNSMEDSVSSGLFSFSSYTLPLYAGSWDYVITNVWTIPGSPTTNFLMSLTSTSSLIDADGDFSVSKCGITVKRTINDVITISP